MRLTYRHGCACMACLAYWIISLQEEGLQVIRFPDTV